LKQGRGHSTKERTDERAAASMVRIEVVTLFPERCGGVAAWDARAERGI
jgi:hypothetical protein